MMLEMASNSPKLQRWVPAELAGCIGALQQLVWQQQPYAVGMYSEPASQQLSSESEWVVFEGRLISWRLPRRMALERRQLLRTYFVDAAVPSGFAEALMYPNVSWLHRETFEQGLHSDIDSGSAETLRLILLDAPESLRYKHQATHLMMLHGTYSNLLRLLFGEAEYKPDESSALQQLFSSKSEPLRHVPRVSLLTNNVCLIFYN